MKARAPKAAPPPRPPLAYTVDQYVTDSGLARRRIYNLIASGDLRSFKVGRRRMISYEAGRELIEKLEQAGAE